MKTLALLSFIVCVTFTTSMAQDPISNESFEKYWNSLSEHNHQYSEQKKYEEKIEIKKIKALIHQSIQNELREVKILSSDVITNFAVIEDHFHAEFEALGLPYTRYEHHEERGNIPLEHWVNHHARKIIQHKMARVEKEIKEFYD